MLKSVERINIYSKEALEEQYLVIHASLDTNGIHRDYFTVSSYKGYKTLERLQVVIQKTSYKKEEELFQGKTPINCLYGQQESLSNFVLKKLIIYES